MTCDMMLCDLMCVHLHDSVNAAASVVHVFVLGSTKHPPEKVGEGGK